MISEKEASPLKETRRLLRVARRVRAAAIATSAVAVRLVASGHSAIGRRFMRAAHRMIWLHENLRERARASLAFPRTG